VRGGYHRRFEGKDKPTPTIKRSAGRGGGRRNLNLGTAAVRERKGGRTSKAFMNASSKESTGRKSSCPGSGKDQTDWSELKRLLD